MMLYSETMEIIELAEENLAFMSVILIKGTPNQETDWLSGHSEYCLNQEAFKLISQKFILLEVNLFVGHKKRKLA